MIRNIILVSARNLLHNPSYSVLNVLGLTLGITGTLFLTLYIIDETGYDAFHQKGDRIHRIVTTVSEGGADKYYNSTQIPLADELKSKYTSVEDVIRFIEAGRELFEVADRDMKFYEEKFYFTDPSVLQVFTFPLMRGDPETALTSPFTAVITQATAQRFFGTSDAIGKTFSSKGKTYTVTGVAEDLPGNSSIDFDALLSIYSFPLEKGSWTGWYPDTYVLIAEKSSPAEVTEALSTITAEHVAPNFSNTGISVSYWLQPMKTIHLKSGFTAEGGDKLEYVYIFLSILVFILILTCINYINLATSRASRRAKEIGIRKASGASKPGIVAQFLAESVMLTFASLFVSVVTALMLLPYFNEMSGKSIGLSFFIQPLVVLVTTGLTLSIALTSGIYPALLLSRMNPVWILKGNFSRGPANATLRKTLVSIQFAISIGMIICTSVVYDQLSFMRNSDLGFNRDQVLYVELADSATMAGEAILSEKLSAHARVISVASSSSMPGKGIDYRLMQVDTENGAASQVSITTTQIMILLRQWGSRLQKVAIFPECLRGILRQPW